MCLNSCPHKERELAQCDFFSVLKNKIANENNDTMIFKRKNKEKIEVLEIIEKIYDFVLDPNISEPERKIGLQAKADIKDKLVEYSQFWKRHTYLNFQFLEDSIKIALTLVKLNKS